MAAINPNSPQRGGQGIETSTHSSNISNYELALDLVKIQIDQENSLLFARLSQEDVKQLVQLKKYLEEVSFNDSEFTLKRALSRKLPFGLMHLRSLLSDALSINRECFDVRKIILYNKAIRQCAYLDESKKFITRKLETILAEFKITDLEPAEIDISISFVTSEDESNEPYPVETHNGCRSPLIIILSTQERGEIVKFIYKPRLAELDQTIIAAFEMVNHVLELEEVGVALPIYKILPLEEENTSLWEFIEGETLSGPGLFEHRIQFVNTQAEDAFFFQKTILSILEIKDLHQENFIYVPLLERLHRAVPIDLEVSKLRTLEPINADFNFRWMTERMKDEFKHIVQFAKKAVLKAPKRLIVIGTTRLAALTANPTLWPATCKAIISSLRKAGFKLLDENVLQNKLLKSLLCNDVPYLVLKERFVYTDNLHKEPVAELVGWSNDFSS